MPIPFRLPLLIVITALAGCVSMPQPSEGKHLVYRDASGTPIRQFDYPSDDICRRVQAVAGSSARCQNESLGQQMQARATLRYVPPGILVEGHYLDLTRCQSDTGSLGAGVELVNPCAAK
jgi:hypothetical protein